MIALNSSKVFKSQSRIPTRCSSPSLVVQSRSRLRMLRMILRCNQSFRKNLLSPNARFRNQMWLAKSKSHIKVQKERLIVVSSVTCPKLHLVRRSGSRSQTKWAASRSVRWLLMSLEGLQVLSEWLESPAATKMSKMFPRLIN